MDKTFIGVRQLAAGMGVSEKTVYRMLTDNQLPFAVKIGGQWRFRKDAVENWLVSQAQGESVSGKTDYGITVTKALGHGSVLYRIHGGNRDEALGSLLGAIPHHPGFDEQKIRLSILIRESMASSCLGGVACMTTSPEHPVYTEKSLVIFAFLEETADFKALDRQAAQAVFLILSANAVEQAILETRLRRLLMEGRFIEDILRQPGRIELQQLFNDWENKLLPSCKR
jgi:PTS system nitrogen regulatory IIA component